MPELPVSHKIFFYGLPGSGKDIQSARLAASLGVPHFSAGQILRDEAASGSDLGRAIRPYLESGNIIPHEMATAVLFKKFMSVQYRALGYCVSGYPRTLGSLKTYLEHDRPTAVFCLRISEDCARQRLLRRARTDDTPELIEQRIQRYNDLDPLTIAYLKSETAIPVIEIDGSLSEEEVARLISEQLQDYLSIT